ncbi:glycosyl transferase family 1 [Paenibacillus sambharensis]|uniref:Glycosyl transferase family 1 n=1 Tax=Paenibacillus sambharensis TaxID=1803190 RepID=A0A2W1L9V6_9BACL|nr:glycosyltransferase family 4 protein [Paenibacillus sambharensis]PZD97008.1 glycosyl transferase family 1 [Paenibacillus sambharensis]
MTKIAYIGTYVPQKCGIATYTHHLRQSVRAAKGWTGIDPVIAITPAGWAEEHTDPALQTLEKEDRDAYRKLAERLNASDAAVVSLQHEFGIFGGEAGSYILDFIEHLEKPLAVTFHTVFEEPQEPYRSIQRQIAERSDLILIMNRQAGAYLERSFHIPRDKIKFVPHGTPEPAPGKREVFREAHGWDGRKVLMTFGLLSRGKGLETIIRALPEVAKEIPDVLYAIVGQTHPEVRKHEGEAYREELKELAQQLGVENHVVMVDRYVEEDELVGYLSACDLYLTPYPGMQQITSGTLAYAVGLGRPVLSTPYAYAKDLLGSHPYLLLPPGEHQVWASRMISILSDDHVLSRWEDKMAKIGESMHWSKSGALHLRLFGQLVRDYPVLQAN